jgi:hypothetical protein
MDQAMEIAEYSYSPDFSENIENKRINNLEQQIKFLSNKITIAPAIRGMIGGGAAAYFLLKPKDTATKMMYLGIGGALGYYMLRNKHLPDDQVNAIKLQIQQLSNELNSLQRGQEIAGGGLISSESLLQNDYDVYPFDGKYLELIGEPTTPFACIIFGLPKSGKSIFSIQFADYLGSNFGRVLYIASEEGFSPTLQKKVKDFVKDSSNLDFAPFKTYEEIIANDLSPYSFVFIDSLNFAKITVEQLEMLKTDYPAISFITIMQSTKGGNFRGSQEFAHNCDVIVTIQNGIATQKGRFQAQSSCYVFDEPEEENVAEIPQTNNAPAYEYEAESSF